MELALSEGEDLSGTLRIPDEDLTDTVRCSVCSLGLAARASSPSWYIHACISGALHAICIRWRPKISMLARKRSGPLLASNFVDAVSRQAADFTIDVIAVTTLSASATEMGVLNALGTLAFLIFGIPIGVLVDRMPHVRTIFMSGLLRCGVLSTVVLAWSLEALTIPHVYGAAFVAGTASVFTETAQTAITPHIAGKDAVSSIISTMRSAESAIGLVVPAAAGTTIALIGAGPLLAIAAAFSVLAALIILKQNTAEIAESGEQKVVTNARNPNSFIRFFREAREGWATLKRTRVLWRLTVCALLMNFGLAVHSAIEVILVLRTLGLDESVLGLIVSSGALGGFAGSLIALPLTKIFSQRKVLQIAAWILPAAAMLTFIALIDLSRAVGWLLAGALCWGVLIVIFNILIAGLTAESIPTKFMGRVSASRRTLTMGIVPIGSIAGGLLGDLIAISVAVVAWISLTLIAAAVSTSALVREA
ncbi:MAG TPA: MFS transporter [Ruania sp.]|nr:MFS transporter [Ruania sp.]